MGNFLEISPCAWQASRLAPRSTLFFNALTSLRAEAIGTTQGSAGGLGGQLPELPSKNLSSVLPPLEG
jgi:hypothetical protein